MRKNILINKHHTLLANHLVLGKPIFPAVAYFDMIFQALQELYTDGTYTFPWQVTNAFWFTPLDVPGHDLSVALELHHTQEKCTYRVQSGGPEHAITHASGVVGAAASMQHQRA